MKKRDYGDFVQDILDSINDIGSFIEGMDFEDFIKEISRSPMEKDGRNEGQARSRIFRC